MPRSSAPLPGRPVRGSDTGRPIMALLDLLGRRWALRVLWELRETPAPTFRDLQARCGGLSSSVLSDRLAELSEARIVHRGDDGYTLTADGKDLLSRLLTLEDWSERWAARLRPLATAGAFRRPVQHRGEGPDER
jgi:DNA-binding HxlR family transcriptional regulator